MLTKSEIIELRARAICKASGYNPDSAPCSQPLWKANIHLAEATIEADEKAGVLMLVEEGGSKTQELIDFDNWYRAEYKVKPSRDCMFDPMHHQGFRAWLAARANTPVYQCKKEENNHDK